jgi:DNA methyltransferase 1-associated protein 1
LKSLQATQRSEVIEESPIVPAFVGPMKKKAKSGKRVTPWTRFEYQNKDGPGAITLSHVRPLDDPNKNVNVFLRFNAKSKIFVYTNDDQYRLVESKSWSREETDALMRLAEQFDGRLLLVHDRWDGPTPRSLDEIKARFYEVQQRLASADSELSKFSFDLEGSVKRKRHAEILYNRNGNEVWEEFEAKKEFEPVAAELAKAKAAPGRVRTLMTALDQGLKE